MRFAPSPGKLASVGVFGGKVGEAPEEAVGIDEVRVVAVIGPDLHDRLGNSSSEPARVFRSGVVVGGSCPGRAPVRVVATTSPSLGRKRQFSVPVAIGRRASAVFLELDGIDASNASNDAVYDLVMSVAAGDPDLDDLADDRRVLVDSR